MAIETKTMNGVHVREISYEETRRGMAFVAQLYVNSKKIGTIQNNGDGSGTRIRTTPAKKADLMRRCEKFYTDNNLYMGVIPEETFAEAIIDLYEFGKFLTKDEIEAWLTRN